MLTPSQTVLYDLLKNHLPDHEVLAHVSLAAFVDAASVSGFERETHQRRLAGVVVDFVVCDKSFKAVAVVQCGVREGSSAGAGEFAAACVRSTGLRWVEVAPEALPNRVAIKSLVLGI